VDRDVVGVGGCCGTTEEVSRRSVGGGCRNSVNTAKWKDDPRGMVCEMCVCCGYMVDWSGTTAVTSEGWSGKAQEGTKREMGSIT
jgi:hypothetical protein